MQPLEDLIAKSNLIYLTPEGNTIFYQKLLLSLLKQPIDNAIRYLEILNTGDRQDINHFNKIAQIQKPVPTTTSE